MLSNWCNNTQKYLKNRILLGLGLDDEKYCHTVGNDIKGGGWNPKLYFFKNLAYQLIQSFFILNIEEEYSKNLS